MFFRLLLIGLLIYLVVSAVSRFLTGGGKKDRTDDDADVSGGGDKKGVPRDMGEYVDYEELDDDND
ncbi:MAG: hypothetical protein U5K32_08625 [Bacteroidales bacterium]|nr:hypothetical protein [Bacteroidales bacterium]